MKLIKSETFGIYYLELVTNQLISLNTDFHNRIL